MDKEGGLGLRRKRGTVEAWKVSTLDNLYILCSLSLSVVRSFIDLPSALYASAHESIRMEWS